MQSPSDPAAPITVTEGAEADDRGQGSVARDHRGDRGWKVRWKIEQNGHVAHVAASASFLAN